MSENYMYGIAWTRGEDPEIHHGTVTWYESEGEARFWHRERDDKYWPSTLVRAPLGEIEVVEAGKCPWEVGK